MLTPLKIDRLKLSDTTKSYADRDGLTLKHKPNGKKIFVFRFQWLKKQQNITIGHYPFVSLADARNIAFEYRALVNNGVVRLRLGEPKFILITYIVSSKPKIRLC